MFGGAFNFAGDDDDDDEALEELVDILLQADLGMKTAEDVVNEVKSLQEASKDRLTKDDLISIMHDKLIEVLQLDS